MRDAKGLADLAVLVASPGTPVAATERAAGGSELVAAAVRQGADDMLDETARRQYRARLADLAEEIDEAERWSDSERAARALVERDELMEALSAATGLGGRVRRLGDPHERARKAVTARIRDAVARISRVHPELGEHLATTVNTGAWCSYSPHLPT